MKIIFFISFLAALLAITFGAVVRIQENPAYPNKCYYEETGVMEPKEVKYLKRCARATCSGTEIEIATCGVVSFKGNCTLERDLSKDYPGCCPKPKCSLY